ncbi:MOB kinase activator 3B isoform X3 [Heliangelus exortis]|uniref:MOB kinase activator 3B isoform X3 n=1 Tax=Heliangelus exortis TaxID=472823 RepID=UPI003A94089C
MEVKLPQATAASWEDSIHSSACGPDLCHPESVCSCLQLPTAADPRSPAWTFSRLPCSLGSDGHEAFWKGFQEEQLVDCPQVDKSFSEKKNRAQRICDREQLFFCKLLQRRRLADMSIALKQVFNKDKTFRPKRKFEPGTQRFELHKRAQASLNSGVNLKAAVQLPSGEDQNDWVAVHVVDFFNRINLIYGTICEFCTERTCPVMSGGPKYEYRWQDDMKYKKPTALPAPQYMNLLMDWIEMQINNEDIFPTNVVSHMSGEHQDCCALS